MISVEQAVSLVLQRAVRRPPTCLPVGDAVGLVLAEAVTSDLDSPPHDKSLVDGYAICASDLVAGRRELVVLEQITAGQTPRRTVQSGYATRIMTGAPIPDGADAVVMVEETEDIQQAGQAGVRIQQAAVRPGQNIMRRGISLRRGEAVLAQGQPIRPIEVGLLSEVGRTHIEVYPRPTVAVLATGNELVDADTLPAAGCIRNSNGPMLRAMAQRAGATAVDLGIKRDDHRQLVEGIRVGLKQDVLLLSGGVSAGVLDLVPQALAEVQVKEVFHKVHLKPGKPLWFGVWPEGGDEQKLVFGLPGNPVSSLVCFELFVRPALGKLSGRQLGLTRRDALLDCAHRHRGERPTYHPARLQQHNDQETVEPVAWHGSADLRALTDANCLAYFPAGDRQYEAGETVPVFLL